MDNDFDVCRSKLAEQTCKENDISAWYVNPLFVKETSFVYVANKSFEKRDLSFFSQSGFSFFN